MLTHYMAIGVAVTGVALSNYASAHDSKSLRIFSLLLTLAFCLLCFHEVSWTGLFLAVFSPNVTDVLNSFRK